MGSLSGKFDSFGTMINADNLLDLSNVLANSYQGWTRANIMDIYEDTARRKKEYAKESQEIDKLFQELGGNDLFFNSLGLTDTGNQIKSEINTYLPETLNGFIGRTLMTGSDIVELSFLMITDYANINLQLPKN